MAENTLPAPYVAFFQGPDGRNDRFQVQGMVDREAIGCAVQALVDLLDVIDGDPDLEGECSEDEVSRCTDWGLPVRADGPGCIIADPDEGVDDKGEQTRDEDDWCHHSATGPGCPIADPGGEVDGF